MKHRPPYDSDSPVAWENYVVVLLTQSMLGLLSNDVEWVKCRIKPDEIELHFCANGDVTEDMKDILTDMSVFLADTSTSLALTIHDASSTTYRPGPSDRTLRHVYKAKPRANG